MDTVCGIALSAVNLKREMKQPQIRYSGAATVGFQNDLLTHTETEGPWLCVSEILSKNTAFVFYCPLEMITKTLHWTCI